MQISIIRFRDIYQGINTDSEYYIGVKIYATSVGAFNELSEIILNGYSLKISDFHNENDCYFEKRLHRRDETEGFPSIDIAKKEEPEILFKNSDLSKIAKIQVYI